jgi:hypothetical protein
VLPQSIAFNTALSEKVEGLVSQPVGEKGEQVLSQGRSLSKGTSKGNSSRKVVKTEEVEGLLEDGWEPMMTLPDGRVIMRAALPRV